MTSPPLAASLGGAGDGPEVKAISRDHQGSLLPTQSDRSGEATAGMPEACLSGPKRATKGPMWPARDKQQACPQLPSNLSPASCLHYSSSGRLGTAARQQLFNRVTLSQPHLRLTGCPPGARCLPGPLPFHLNPRQCSSEDVGEGLCTGLQPRLEPGPRMEQGPQMSAFKALHLCMFAFEPGSCCVARVERELVTSCLSLPSAEITDMLYHAWLSLSFL
jgi:hypothetical protein